MAEMQIADRQKIHRTDRARSNIGGSLRGPSLVTP
jgi:hypothetical protein